MTKHAHYRYKKNPEVKNYADIINDKVEQGKMTDEQRKEILKTFRKAKSKYDLF